MIRYRLAVPEDAGAIARVHAASWQAGYRGILGDQWLDTQVHDDRAVLWQARFAAEDPSRFLAVAENERGLVAFICAFARADERFGSLIDNVHVLPEATGQGIGTQLLARAFETMRKSAADAGVFLWVYQQNAGARRLYERLGARCAETVTKPTPDGGSARLCRYVWRTPADFVQGAA